MGTGRRWTRDEVLLALHLYERLPFGQQHERNREVVSLAARLGRTSGSVAMKLNNFTSLDPEEQVRGIKGLAGASDLDRATWAEFRARPEVVEEAERLWLEVRDRESQSPPIAEWQGATDREASRHVRLAQSYFRRVVLANFAGSCALTGIATGELLTASHIVGWAEAPEHRVDPQNGLCLNRLHDAAFDKKLITFDEDLRLVVGRRLRDTLPQEPLAAGFLRYEGIQLRPPEKRSLNPAFLDSHRAGFVRANTV